MDETTLPPPNSTFTFDTSFLPTWAVILAALVAGCIILLTAVVVMQRFRRREPAVVPPPIDLGIDISNLPAHGPVDDTLRAEVYGTSVRVAVIVLAPVGRKGVAPLPNEFPGIVEQLVPGFGEVVMRDQPLVRAWSGQVSSHGFANAFFNNVPLPGDRGKGTPWCSLVGKFTADRKQYLAGLICCAHSDNALSQYVIRHEGKWNDVLRVRKS